MENKLPADAQKYMDEIKFGELWARHSLLVNKLDVGKYRIDKVGLTGVIAEVLRSVVQRAPTGPRWVKASERLPVGAGRITWRWLDQEAAYIGFDGTSFIYDKGGARVDMLYAVEIEWLDESDTPEQQSDALSRKHACDFAEWMRLNCKSSQNGWVDALGKWDTTKGWYDHYKQNLTRGKEGGV